MEGGGEAALVLWDCVGREEGGAWLVCLTGSTNRNNKGGGSGSVRVLGLGFCGPGCELDLVVVLGNKNIKGPFILLVKIPHGPIL